MKIQAKHILNWTLILALNLTGISMSLGDVLCISADGHARIEESSIPCCADEHGHFQEGSDNIAAFIMPGDRCTDCSDIPIGIVSLVKRYSIKKNFSAIKFCQINLTALTLTNDLVYNSENIYPFDRCLFSIASISQSSLNTTVLLC